MKRLARLQAEQQADMERAAASEPLSPYATECARHKRDTLHADLTGRTVRSDFTADRELAVPPDAVTEMP
jgi:hypothetical protein